MGLLVSIEETGYTGDKSRRLTNLLPGWDVRKVKKIGASAVKLLIYYRPDLKDIVAKQRGLVEKLAEQCLNEDIPLLVEVVSYPLDTEGEKDFAQRKPQLVIEAARQITSLPIEVLKAEFPADPNYEKDETKLFELCRELDKASRLPWVLLSDGAKFDTFQKQVEIACKSGASGFLAGRALWQEATQIRSRTERMRFFENTAAPRLKKLAEIANACGTPWFSKLRTANGEFPAVTEGWYQTY